jgi:hypothetical protein
MTEADDFAQIFCRKLENSFQIFGDAFHFAKMGKENLQHIGDTTPLIWRKYKGKVEG